MAKTIWFINDYAGSRYHGMEFRNYYFAKEFVKMGYSVYIISASYMHLFKKLPEVEGSYKFEELDGINYLWLKVPKYSESTSKKRVLKWFVFSAKLFALPLSKMQKPDVVIASPMAPFLAVPAYRLAKKYSAKFVYEVKDIWPLSIVELGGISLKHPLIRAMSWCEKFAIKRADVLVSSLFNYGEHLKIDLGIEKSFVWVNNGIDLDEMQNTQPLESSVKELIPKDKFIIGYAGTVGIANALETLCEAAKLLKNREEIAFVVVGDGKEKKNLVDTYGNLDNIIFINPIPKNEVQSVLSLFDICYIGWNKEKLYNYGISANKIFDYMYSAKPIIHAFSGKGDLVKLAKCGVSVEAQNPNKVAGAIEELYGSREELRRELGENGKRYVLENFTYEKLAEKFLAALF